MTAVMVKAFTDLRRRRLQAAVILLTTLLAVGTGTMALTIIFQTTDPYQAAFDAQRGAHLQVVYDVGADPALIARTPSLIGSSAAGGPYRETGIQFQAGGNKYTGIAVGRDDPAGDVEQLRMVAGRWPVAAGEVALTRSFSDLNHVRIGDHLKVVSVPDKPVLTVVAEVADIDEVRADINTVQRVWVVESAIGSLTDPASSTYLMNYRFASDPTAAELQADVGKLRAFMPAGSITSSVNYIYIRSIFNISNQVLIGLLIAFSIFALGATAAIVANLVTGIVISGFREIGIMKAVGFTPAQVVGVFMLQILIPALVACLVGIPAGTVLSQPLLADTSQSLGLAYQPTFSLPVDVLALAGAALIIALAALIPALRAGLLKPAIVIANATAPGGHSGRWLRGLASRASLPRPLALGLGDAVARPVRAMLTLLAVFVSVATVVVAMGETRSFAGIYTYEGHYSTVNAVIKRSPAFSDADATRLINSQPETSRVVAQTDTDVTVPGIADPVYTAAFRGDSGALGYQVTAGRWISGPGEVVAPKGLLQDAHLKIGDSFTASFHAAELNLRVVGELYDFIGGPGGHELMLDWSTIAPFGPDVAPTTYLVALKPGSSVDAFSRRLAAAQPDLLDVRVNSAPQQSAIGSVNLILYAISAVLMLIAAASIFNTLLLNTRERVRDTATLKALGMTARQVVGMVAASAGFLALVGALVALPAGVELSRLLFDLVVGTVGGVGIPSAAYGSFALWELVAILLVAVALAVAAAMIPARWAARTNVIEALHAE
ncbi:MAG: FtsX-like permease family protein [Candidatus Dormibacteraeota bacterium]|nr:FtsX-like permease family protein [Candidatus Dormibacteraeota bacterium]